MGRDICLRSAELCGLGGSLMDLRDCAEDQRELVELQAVTAEVGDSAALAVQVWWAVRWLNLAGSPATAAESISGACRGIRTSVVLGGPSYGCLEPPA